MRMNSVGEEKMRGCLERMVANSINCKAWMMMLSLFFLLHCFGHLNKL